MPSLKKAKIFLSQNSQFGESDLRLNHDALAGMAFLDTAPTLDYPPLYDISIGTPTSLKVGPRLTRASVLKHLPKGHLENIGYTLDDNIKDDDRLVKMLKLLPQARQVVVDKVSQQVICTNFSNGKRHDFRLFKEFGVRFSSRTEVLTDTGYQGLHKLHTNSRLPKTPNHCTISNYIKLF